MSKAEELILLLDKAIEEMKIVNDCLYEISGRAEKLYKNEQDQIPIKQNQSTDLSGPVAWRLKPHRIKTWEGEIWHFHDDEEGVREMQAKGWTIEPLYLHPPKSKPFIRLADDEIREIVGPFAGDPISGYTRKLFDEIQDKLEKVNGH